MAELTDLIGKRIVSIRATDERIDIETDDGQHWAGYHMQDCCESVSVASVDGDPQSLVGRLVTHAADDCVPQGDPKPEYPDSWTWTHWEIAAGPNRVVFHWLGESNGYYGEEPHFGITHAPGGPAKCG